MQEEWTMSRIIAEDMEYINGKADHGKLDGSRVLISGATGLIGKYLVRFLAEYCNCTVFVIVRDMEKARTLWADLGSRIQYIHSDIAEVEAVSLSVDYMIHGASNTSSKSFSAEPVEIICTAVEGTRRMLELARKNPVKGFLFLSTMEVYGTPSTDHKIWEGHGCNLDTMAARSSYPESKRLCESLCAAYYSEYQVPAKVLRLTQTFGPGVAYDDPRVFAEFARCVMEGKDIILHTKGETKRNYLYLADACTAILTVLTKGTAGEAYNGANEGTYCSIREMAELVTTLRPRGEIRVKIEPEKGFQERFGYAPVLRMNLDTGKLRGLGWKPEVSLLEMYERMISAMTEENKVILFGSGEIGYEALTFLGSEHIWCFCDNDPNKRGAEKCGKKIISFSELKQKYRDAVVLVSASQSNADKMVQQCEENGIRDYLVYEPLRELCPTQKEMLDCIHNPESRMGCKIAFFISKAKELRLEVDYFKRHADICSMKPAEGMLREWQFRLVQAATDFFRQIRDLEIKPYLCSGNLIGYVRHNGFIPWDDDIDFSVIRDEYERLKEYCRTHFKPVDEIRKEGRVIDGIREKGASVCGYYLEKTYDFLQLYVVFSDGCGLNLDFFPMDYYSETCDFHEFMDFARQVKERWRTAQSDEEKERCMEAAKRENEKYTAKESGNIYYGIDNMGILQSYHRGRWIPKEVLFPLRQVLYEGEYFWVPNEPEEYLRYEYQNMYEFPKDNIGFPQHFFMHNIKE